METWRRKPCLLTFVAMKEWEEVVCKLSASSDPSMNESIDGIVKTFLIDSGSVSNLTREDVFRL